MVAVLVLGCTKQVQPVSPADRPENTLERARERSVPDPVRTRLDLELAAPAWDLGGRTGGGLVIDRPGRGRLDVFGPLGGRLATATTDGAALSVALARDRRALVAADAEVVVREVTGGLVGVDDLLALLVGDLPLDGAEVASLRRDDQGVHLDLVGPASTRVTALLEPERAVPLAVQGRNAEGEILLDVTYGEWERVQGRWLPSGLHLEVPTLALTLDLRYDEWVVPEQDPEVFGTEAPDGFETRPLEEAVRGLVEG
jgi:hypothetical protein